MMYSINGIDRFRLWEGFRRHGGWFHAALLSFTVGCGGILNPAFVDTLAFVDENSIIAASTLQNPPGHVVVQFVNNTTFDPDLIAYLRRVQPSAIPDDESSPRPRIRFRVRVTFTDASFLEFEFVDGAEVFQAAPVIGDAELDAIGDVPVPADLTANELRNGVVVCDVARVEIVGNVELYIPVFTKVIQITASTLGGNPTRQLTEIIPRAFVPLIPDEVDENLSTLVVHNFGIRDVPAPVENLLCGTVVTAILTGVLDIPFVVDENGDQSPGFLDTDDAAAAAIPGRFRLTIQLQ